MGGRRCGGPRARSRPSPASGRSRPRVCPASSCTAIATFLLGPQFCSSSGAQLLPDPLIVTLYGEPVLVMHGDALCTDDRAYQRLRATVRDADWQRRFLALSVAARRALAGAARVGSQAHTAAVEYAITDVNAESVAAALRAAGTATCCTGTRTGPPFIPSKVDGRALYADRARRLVHPRQRIAVGCERPGVDVPASLNGPATMMSAAALRRSHVKTLLFFSSTPPGVRRCAHFRELRNENETARRGS